MENKDEQIRKELIYFIRKEKEYIESKVKPENSPKLMFLIDSLAYLERQKEQKPESCDCSRDEESYTNGVHHVLMNPEAYGLIKQKPTEQLGGTFTSYDMAKTFMEGQNYVITHPEKFGLCKPAEWSEEDEIEHDYLCKLLRETWDKVDKGSCIDDAITWLEKLPERICLHSWKPSEKQIGILGKVFAGCQLKDSERDSMVDLFYHLKDMI